jgi:molybdate transport system substrate-binding protein
MKYLLAMVLLVTFGPADAPLLRAADVTAAVAANFSGTARRVADAFERETPYTVNLVVGSTGKHYAQIVNGAPFDVLLAADRDRPARLEREGRIVPGSRFTYATGRLVLWSPVAGRVDARGAILARGDFRHLALANPRLAPYGVAAQETLAGMGLWARLHGRLVFGENVGQAFRFVDSGAAELGFVALAQVRLAEPAGGSWWLVPDTLYTAIEQQAVQLRENVAAVAFLHFLRGETARSIIVASGYGAPDVQ